MLDKFHAYRFELFLITQLFILFGSIIIPLIWFENWVMPVFILFNIASGVLLVSKNKGLSKLLFLFLILSFIMAALGFINLNINEGLGYLKLSSYFIFYAIVTIEIVRQVWKVKVVNKNVILGLINGFISLGLLGFFLFLTIEIIYPNSFSGIVTSASSNADLTDHLMYFSFVTLMTIGYGDILPISPIAQKATIFIGLIGQFYLVILTAIVVGKYINQSLKTN